MLESLMIGRPGEGSVEPEAPAEIGAFWEGGYYTGMIQVNGNVYALVLAPKAQGESPAGLRWKTTNTGTPGAASLNDGWSNTQAMMADSVTAHSAARFCHDLVIDGYDDWYLPSVDELEICYRAFKPDTTINYVSVSDSPYGANGINPSSIPVGAAYTDSNPTQTTLEIFKKGGSQAFTTSPYWSSTQFNTTYSWRMFFSNGREYAHGKDAYWYVRAVRRVLIK